MKPAYSLNPVGSDHGSKHLTPGLPLASAKVRAHWLAEELRLDVEVWDLTIGEVIATVRAPAR